MSILNYIFLC